tara:strand:+ start:1861 stop:2604 length:744 start_codon:yes stop_codon:yes gene_type:complete
MKLIKIRPKIEKTKNCRLGLIALATDFTIEKDFNKILSNKPISFYVNRLPSYNPLSRKNYLKMNSKLTEITKNILPKQKFNSIAYGCTSGTIASGNRVIRSKILKAKPKSKVSDPISSAINAFKKLKIKKLTIFTPYAESINKTVVDYLIKRNFKIIEFHYLNLSSDVDIGQVDIKFLFNYLSKLKLKNSDGLFISCTALPVLDILDKLEKKLKKNVLSSNQVLIWDSLRNAGYKKPIKGYGRLMRI